jgi:hypothetical protein
MPATHRMNHKVGGFNPKGKATVGDELDAEASTVQSRPEKNDNE